MKAFILLLFIVSTQHIKAEQPGRYISLAPHLTELLFELGVGEQIVGTVEYSDYPEAASRIPVIGNHHQLNIEAIVAAKPDVIFAWPEGNPDLQLSRLEKAGLRLFKSSPATLEELGQEILAIGKQVNRSQAAENLLETMQQSVARITTRYQGRDKVRVYYELWYQPLRTLGSDPWLNDLITRCGGVNVFNHLPQSFPLISVEAVLKKDPDLILSPATNMEQSWHDHWSDWPGLKAVKTNSVAYINADWVHRYTSRSIKGLQQLCEIIHEVRLKAEN